MAHLVCLNDESMKVVFPVALNDPHPFIVYMITGERIDIDRKADQLPFPEGYQVIEITKGEAGSNDEETP